MERRSRPLPFHFKCGTIRSTSRSLCGPNHQLPPDQTVVQRGATKVGSQVTDSEEHPGWKRRVKRPDADTIQDIGGDFKTTRSYVEGYPSYGTMDSGEFFTDGCTAQRVKYTGNVWAIDPVNFPFPTSVHSSDSALDQLGATAVARCKPTNSAANIGVALGELIREGIPKLVTQSWQRRTEDLKALADEHLNYQFGLKPLGQEIGTFAFSVTEAGRLLEQYERDAGKPVRRRYKFPPIKTMSLTSGYGSSEPYYGGPQYNLANTSIPLIERERLEILRTTEINRWFSGTFVYYLPRGYDARNEMDAAAFLAKEILGLDLDLETIWNLAPWSWAVDWFSNAGDVISNVNDFLEDGLVMPYGYIMEHSVVKHTYTRARPDLMKGMRCDSAVTLVTETKLRRKANPFGFGVKWEGLSTLQHSILAALGITRLR